MPEDPNVQLNVDPTPDPSTPVPEPQKFSVTVDGEPVEVTQDELTRGYIREQTWTKRMQALADQRRSFEDQARQFQEERRQTLETVQQLQNFFSDPQKVMQYAAMLNQQQHQPQWDPADPESVSSYVQKQAEVLLDKRIQPLQQAYQTSLEQLRGEMDRSLRDQERARLRASFNSTVDSVLKQFPQLVEADGEMAGFILRQVANEKYENASRLGEVGDDAVSFVNSAIVAAGKERVAKLDAYRKASGKRGTPAVAADAGTEPPGGGGITPTPRPARKLGSKELMDDVMDRINKAAERSVR